MDHKIILGTVQFGLDYGINNSSGKPDKAKVFDILKEAYDQGIRVLDTADGYGDSSELISAFTKESGKKFKLISKFVVQDKSESAHQIFSKTLQRLECDSLECYFFHRFDDYKCFQDFEGLLFLVDDGRIML